MNQIDFWDMKDWNRVKKDIFESIDVAFSNWKRAYFLKYEMQMREEERQKLLDYKMKYYKLHKATQILE